MQSVESKDTAAAADVGNNNIWMNLNLETETNLVVKMTTVTQDWRVLLLSAGVGAVIAGISFYIMVIKPR